MPKAIFYLLKGDTIPVEDLQGSLPCPPQTMKRKEFGLMLHTLLETNMETQKGPYKDYSPSKMGLYGFPC